MLLEELFVSMGEYRNRWTQYGAEDEAAVITRRLRELLDIASTQIGTSLSKPAGSDAGRSANDKTGVVHSS
jgi:hypothetical protein